jgi:histone H3/H4
VWSGSKKSSKVAVAELEEACVTNGSPKVGESIIEGLERCCTAREKLTVRGRDMKAWRREKRTGQPDL